MSRECPEEGTIEREQQAIDRAYEQGELTDDEYRTESRAIDELRGSYEADLYAQQSLHDEWDW